MFEGKNILITGGTGSFGKWMTRELLKHNPSEIRIYSRDEEKQADMKLEFGDERLKFIIGDIRDIQRLIEATKGVHIVYHAAALKIVPNCEEHPMEVLKTNSMGSWNVKQASIENGIEKAILISTDKAVKPVNFYGMTKAIAEKIWVSKEFKSGTKFAVVRYGNVIGSRGSVVPFFKHLIEKGKPLPITHPKMTRFLITLSQAIDLVFYATENTNGHDIFVPDIPTCSILDLSRVMGGENYPLVYTGIRPGEKIHECLIQEDEFHRAEKDKGYYIIHPYAQYDCEDSREEFTSENARRLNKEEIVELLRESGWL